MKKGDIVEGIITSVDFGDKGRLQTDSGEILVLKGTLPGQRVRARALRKKSGTWKAMLLEVLKEAPGQIESPCPHFGDCGGCNYQNYDHRCAEDLKEGQVKRLLEPVLAHQSTPCEWLPPVESPLREAYRNKMEFTFGDSFKDGPLELGLHKRGSFYDIVPVPGCRIAHGDFALITARTADHFRALGLPYYHKRTHEGYLRHLLVRRCQTTGELLIGLVTTSSLSPDLSDYAKSLIDSEVGPRIAGIIHIVNDSPSDTIKCDSMELLYGRDYFYEELLGLRFKVSLFSFFQTNTLGAEQLYKRSRDLIGDINSLREPGQDATSSQESTQDSASSQEPTQDSASSQEPTQDFTSSQEPTQDFTSSQEPAQDSTSSREPFEDSLGSETSVKDPSLHSTSSRDAAAPCNPGSDAGRAPVIYDLYSGTGTIAQMLAPAASTVYGVELIEDAVLSARENAALNGLDNCVFIAGDVLKELDNIPERPDFIVLDPPRDGVHPTALRHIIDYGVDRILYISCKPSSLARDLEVFISRGYEARKVCTVSMFPATQHIETIVLLSKETCQRPDT